MPLSPQEFVAKWEKSQLKERSFYQEHFLDICQMLEHGSPAVDDPSGENFAFEAGAGRGFADVFKRSYFAWEYKGKHNDLDGAYDQLLRYREDLQNPPLLIVSDATLIRIHTNFTNTVKKTYELPIESLLEPKNLAILKAAFFEPTRLKAPETPEMVTEQAAREFARLAELLRKYGENPDDIGHFLIRLLFCLFAEDVGLLPRDLFTRLVARTRRNAAAFKGQLQSLFAAMSTGGWFGEHEITHFNGGLFDNNFALELDSEGIDILASVSGLDWSSIEPSILGTLFERSLDPNKRAQLGAHYTSRDDILLIVEPVLMSPLRRHWDAVRQEARDLASKRDAAKTTRSRNALDRNLLHLLEDFTEEIRSTRVLDPACGSGNFLYVALRQLLDLWKEISTLSGELGLPHLLPTSSPSPEQLYGIEINEYAHELAQATIWIGYIQWLRENGFGQPAPPILKALDNIKLMDALMEVTEVSKDAKVTRVAKEAEWPPAEVIIGNPPFLGSRKMREELGDDYVNAVNELYRNRIPAKSDFVCYWFERSREKIALGTSQRVGLLATQSIRKGLSRRVLERIKTTGDIFMGWSDRPWVLNGAQVRVSMVGFDNGDEQEKTLDGNNVKNINVDLTANIDVTKATKLKENKNIAFPGTKKYGAFDISEEKALEMLAETGNPNGRPNSDVIKPWVNGSDLTRRRRNMWIIDFGDKTPIENAAQYEAPFEYIQNNVKPSRAKVRVKKTREKWWLHERTRPAMREALKLTNHFIATPVVSKHRVFTYLEQPTLPDSKVTVFALENDYFFGVLHSQIHEVWTLNNCSWHGVGNDPTYIISTCFDTFPFPWSPGQEPSAQKQTSEVFKTSEVSNAEIAKEESIAQAAKELNEKRECWLNPEGAEETELKKRTLTNLYNQRPTWLDLAHQKLDHAVCDAYRWAHNISDEEILEKLLALNLERSHLE